MIILRDTREQDGFTFANYPCTIQESGLSTGDYSLLGLADRVAIERKSVPDLVGCLTAGRDRFERELARGRGMDLFAVVVEAPFTALAQGDYRSRMQPHAACQSLIAFQVRYGTPFLWASSRPWAEYLTFWTLQKFLREAESRLKSIIKAHAAAQPLTTRKLQ